MFRHGARAIGSSGSSGGLPQHGYGGHQRGRASFKRSSSATSTASTSKGLNPFVSAALTSCTLTAVGDLVAQTFEQRKSSTKSYDLVRTARLGAFGLCFYGPVQYYWYGFLNRALPVSRSMPLTQMIPPFVGKVAANQLILGPITVSSIFAWNMVFTGAFTTADYTEKWKRDAFRTLQKGWAFWIPAASVNFAIIPLKHQILYMSTCSIVWTTILSAASATPAAKPVEAVQVAVEKGGKKAAIAAASPAEKGKKGQ